MSSDNEQTVEQPPIESKPVLKKRKLPFGHFKVLLNENTEVVIKPLNQDDIAEGWQLALPCVRKGQPVHHWSVSLAQLPPHLWCKYTKEYDEKGKDFYPIIKDRIYYYSVNQTKYDPILKSVYNEMAKGSHADVSLMENLLKELDNQVSGWLITRAKKFVKQSIGNRYYCDLTL